jgi:hippurate hydrolase
MLTEELLQDARSIADRITALRRAIHAEPELGLETPKTLAKVRAELADLPLEWREGPSCTGAVAVLNKGKKGRSVLLRGDMDALPMPEETGLPFASTVPGRMHACGHDTHTAMLAGAVRILADRAKALAWARCASCFNRAKRATTARVS